MRPERLLLVRDYIAEYREFAHEDGEAHQVELMSECNLVTGGAPELGYAPDEMQTGVDWVGL